MAKKKLTLNDVARELSYRSYYETVAYGFITEAIETAVREHGTFESIDELDKYIRTNLI